MAARAQTARSTGTRAPTTITQGYAAGSATTPLAPFTFERREPGPRDVQIDILFCGVCHSDLHTVRDEWGGTVYPVVPGHEIVGRVTEVGDGRQRLQGRRSRRRRLHGGLLPHLRRLPRRPGAVLRGRRDAHLQRRGQAPGRRRPTAATPTRSWSTRTSCCASRTSWIRPARRPLLCAGITTYSPLRHWKVGQGQKVGVVGLGGLGHMGVKLAHAFGAPRSRCSPPRPDKAEDARRLGADEVVVSQRPGADGEARRQLRLHPRHRRGAARPRRLPRRCSSATARWCLVGAPEQPHPSSTRST